MTPLIIGKLILKIFLLPQKLDLYWEEDNQDKISKTNDSIVDVSFKVNCKKIAADHSYDLFEAVVKKFPQIKEIEKPGNTLYLRCRIWCRLGKTRNRNIPIQKNKVLY